MTKANRHRFAPTERGASHPFLRSMCEVTGRRSWTRDEIVLAARVRRGWADETADLPGNRIGQLVREGLLEPLDDCEERALVPLTVEEIVDGLVSGCDDDAAAAKALLDGLDSQARLARLPRSAFSDTAGLHSLILQRVPRSPAALRVALDRLLDASLRPGAREQVAGWVSDYLVSGAPVAEDAEGARPVLEWCGCVLEQPAFVAWHVLAVRLLERCRAWSSGVVPVLLGLADLRGVSLEAVAEARRIVADIIERKG